MAGQVVHRRSGEGPALEVGGDLLVYKASSELGFDSLFFELTVPPGGGPPPHTDPSEELFYVLEGALDFVSEGEGGLTTRPLEPGDAVSVPRGAAHAYRNVGHAPARLLVFFSENARMEGFFRELGDPVADRAHWSSSGPPPLERVRAACDRWGVSFAGAPPA